MISDFLILLSRKANIRIDETQLKLKWRFKEVQFDLPFSNYFECLLSDGVTISAGYGEGPCTLSALRKAFSESVERYVFENFDVLFPKLPRPLSTNGFAAGPSFEFSRLRSVLELVERKVISDAWYLEQGWNEIEFPKNHHEKLKRNGFDSHIYEIKNDSDIRVFCGIIFHPRFGLYLDSLAQVASNRLEIERLSLSLLRGASTIASKRRKLGREYAIVEKMIPEEVGNFYHRENMETAWHHFLTTTTTSTPLEAIKIKSAMEATVTVQLVKGGLVFPHVSYSTNSNWRAFGWGKRTMYGKNPWHLPLV